MCLALKYPMADVLFEIIFNPECKELFVNMIYEFLSGKAGNYIDIKNCYAEIRVGDPNTDSKFFSFLNTRLRVHLEALVNLPNVAKAYMKLDSFFLGASEENEAKEKLFKILCAHSQYEILTITF